MVLLVLAGSVLGRGNPVARFLPVLVPYPDAALLTQQCRDALAGWTANPENL
jgi:hypothetical protein